MKKQSSEFAKQPLLVDLLDSFASHKGVNVAGLRFFLDDEQIDPNLTIAALDLEDGDQVDVFLAQTGC